MFVFEHNLLSLSRRPHRDIVPESAGRGDLTFVDQIFPPPLLLLPRLCLPRPRQSQVVRSGRELFHLEEDGGNDHVDDGDDDDGMSCPTLERKARARSSRSQLRPTLICRSILVMTSFTRHQRCQDTDQLGLAYIQQTL